jgi:hypothetical protein
MLFAVCSAADLFGRQQWLVHYQIMITSPPADADAAAAGLSD